MVNTFFNRRLSVLVLSVLLISCGGGGSEGYYSDNNVDSNGSITSPTTASALKIELSKLSMAATNDTLTVTVRALDLNKGALAGVNISLAVNDNTNTVSILGPSSQLSNADGNATFVLQSSSTSLNIQDLIKQGFSITAKSGNLTQNQTISVTGDSTNNADTTSIVLFDATKTTLNVRGDQTTLILTAVDANGAALANQPISLRILDVAKNGVLYVPLASQTNENGQIKYTLSLSENARNKNYSAEQFVNDGLNLEANFGQSSTVYKYTINIVNSDVPTPVGAISVAYNPTKIEDSSNGVYYYKNISVQVTDVDGKPIPNQDVTMGVNATAYYKGYFSFVDTSVPLDGEADKYLRTSSICRSPSALVNQDGESINQLKPLNGQSVQVVSFINSEGTPATNNKYTTDANGRFDLKIQYPKIFAGWLTIQLNAKTIVSNSLIKGSTTLDLSYMIDDVDVKKLIAPNVLSPYGTNLNCDSAL